MEKHLQVWALKKTIRPVLLDTMAAMHVTCNLCWCIVLVSVSPIMIQLQKVHLFKTKIISTAEREPS